MAAEFSAPLHALQSELNRLLEEYWNPSRVGPGQSTPTDLEPAAWTPAVDVVETPQELVIMAELPGVDPASIDLSVTGNVLTLRGEKRGGDFPEGAGTLRERQFGPFHRQVNLPGEVNFDGVQAEARDGVLKVRLPKQEERVGGRSRSSRRGTGGLAGKTSAGRSGGRGNPPSARTRVVNWTCGTHFSRGREPPPGGCPLGAFAS